MVAPAPPHVRPALTELARQVAEVEEDTLTSDRYETMVRAIAEAQGVGAGKVIHPLRAAMSGRTKGPSLFHMMELLGKDDVLYRLRRALDVARD